VINLLLNTLILGVVGLVVCGLAVCAGVWVVNKFLEEIF
jgi:hypothetical protein